MAKKKKIESNETVALGDLITPQFRAGLGILLESQLPMQAAFKMLKISEKVVEHQRAYEGLRMQLIERHGVRNEAGELQKDASGNSYMISDLGAFDTEFQELLHLPVEIIKISFPEISTAKLSPVILAALLKTIVISVE